MGTLRDWQKKRRKGTQDIRSAEFHLISAKLENGPTFNRGNTEIREGVGSLWFGGRTRAKPGKLKVNSNMNTES